MVLCCLEWQVSGKLMRLPGGLVTGGKCNLMSAYQGHRSRNAWNVALWIANDEGLYRWADDLIKEHGVNKAARIMARELEGQTTPDGGKYNLTCIREALRDWS